MASYNPPNPYVPGAFNPTQFITPSDNITTKYLDENYLRFPFAQGVENFVSINNQGSLNQGGLADFSSNTTPAIFNLPPTITNPIANTATTPANAVATIGYVLANEQGGGDLLPLNNLWTGSNNFNPTPNQTYGATLNQGITITDNQFPPGAQGDNDIISYTPTGSQGLCLYSSSTNSITGQFPQIQLYPDGTETKLSASATNGTIVLAAQGTGGVIQLNATTGVKIGTQPILTFSTFGNLTGSATGIKSSVNLTAPSFIISDGVDDNYQLYSQNNFGFVIANTSGTGLGTLTLSNGSTTLTTLTATTDGLSSNTAVILPPQTTYTPSTTYGNVASTQQFVQQAIASQGGGDVTTGGTNNFTGRNTFDFNLNGGTITTAGLTLARNVETSQNEMDLVSINSTTNNGLNIYCETASVSSASTPKVQFFNDTTPTLFNTPVQIAQGQTGTTYNYTTLTTPDSTYVPSINFLYDSLQALVVNQLGYFTQSATIVTSTSPYSAIYYGFGNNPPIYNTNICSNALVSFSLSTSGKASFSFNPQPLPPNTYSNANAYIQLNPPVWDNGASVVNVAPYFNGNSNVYLLGIWSAATLLGTNTFPFVNPGTINLHQVNMYSYVYEYNTGSQYSTIMVAQVCSFVDVYGSQNIALVVSGVANQPINPNMVVQILPFQITF
jgi:hypothetical protein